MHAFWAEYVNQIPESITILSYAYGLFLFTWPIFLLIEKRMPVQPDTPRSNYIFNWKIVVSNFFLTPLFYALAVTFGVVLGGTFGLPALPYPTPAWSFGIPVLDIATQAIAFFLISCLIQDVWYYWWHRLQHEVPFMWELHKLHHSDENLNSTTIYRSHFFELAGQSLLRGLTIGLCFDLSAMPVTPVAAIAAGLLPPVWDFFIHANVRIDAIHRFLPFLSTPQYHWIHHSKEPEHQDKNYAIWLPVFDMIFGTYFHPRVDEYPATGLSSGEKIETLWEAQVGPLVAWARMLRN